MTDQIPLHPDDIVIDFVVGLEVERAPSLCTETHRLAYTVRESVVIRYSPSPVRPLVLSDLRYAVHYDVLTTFGWEAKWRVVFVRQVSTSVLRFSVEDVHCEFGAQARWVPPPDTYTGSLAECSAESRDDQLCQLEKMLCDNNTTVNQVRAVAGFPPIAGGDVSIGSVMKKPPAEDGQAGLHKPVQRRNICNSYPKIYSACTGDCPQGHHLKEGDCRHWYCSCQCDRCRKQCAEGGY